MAAGLILGLAAMASAATISCGQCHGVYINNPDGTKSVMPGVAATEDVKTPQAGDICGDKGRGLHGIHMNYSSVTYGRAWDSYKKPAAGLAETRGSCSLCHNKHSHENGYVEFSGMTYTDARSDMKVSSVVKVSGTGITANGLDITQMDGTATCTAACHKGTSATSTATWGNYTSAATSLACSSCHTDSSNLGAITIDPATGATTGVVAGYTLSSPVAYSSYSHTYSLKGHYTHLVGEWLGSGANKTIIVMGNYSGPLNMTDNSSCRLCHPDNRNDRYSQGRADDGSKKAYPHAKDGTSVSVFNANFTGGQANLVLTNRTGLGQNPTCTSLCHTNSSSYQKSSPTWGDTWKSGTGGHCDMCHSHQPSAGVNQSASVPLQYAHALHFRNISTMMGRKASCNDCHPEAHTNYAGLPMITKLPTTPGYAGLLAAMNYSAPGTPNGTCQNSCHKYSPSPVWSNVTTNVVIGKQGCSSCHEYPGSTNDWDTVAGVNGHTVRAKFLQNATTAVSRLSIKHLNNALAYNYLTDTYAGVTGDQSLCGKCHGGAAHMSGAIDINANNGLGTSCTPNFTFNNITSGSRVTCSNANCHFGKTTPNWY